MSPDISKLPPEEPLFHQTMDYSRTPRGGLPQEKLSLYAFIIFGSAFTITFIVLAVVFFCMVL